MRQLHCTTRYFPTPTAFTVLLQPLFDPFLLHTAVTMYVPTLSRRQSGLSLEQRLRQTEAENAALKEKVKKLETENARYRYQMSRLDELSHKLHALRVEIGSDESLLRASRNRVQGNQDGEGFGRNAGRMVYDSIGEEQRGDDFDDRLSEERNSRLY